MKKLLLALCVIGLVGCSQAESEVIVDAMKPKPESVDLSKAPDLTSGFDLEFDWQYDLAELYGTKAYKAIHYCGLKYDSMLKGIDTSSDYGSTVLSEWNQSVAQCAENSLKHEPQIPEEFRHVIPRNEPANYGLELNESEVEGFNDIPPMFQPDVNDPRYKEVHAQCAINNQEIVDPVEFASAVDFCTAKGM